MEVNRIQVEAVKLATRGLQEKGLSAEETVLESIHYLLGCYFQTGNEEYPKTALQHMVALLEMGFSYEKHKEIFDQVVSLADIQREDLLMAGDVPKEVYRLTRNRIRTIIGRWRRISSEDMGLNQVVDDIYIRIHKGEEGSWDYTSQNKSGKVLNMFKLTVSQNENILYDVGRDKYYLFRR